jgi:hypothetical protein
VGEVAEHPTIAAAAWKRSGAVEKTARRTPGKRRRRSNLAIGYRLSAVTLEPLRRHTISASQPSNSPPNTLALM